MSNQIFILQKKGESVSIRLSVEDEEEENWWFNPEVAKSGDLSKVKFKWVRVNIFGYKDNKNWI